MINLNNYVSLNEASNIDADFVYVVKLEDGTIVNCFSTLDDAKSCADEMNKEVSSNKAIISKESRSDFEK